MKAPILILGVPRAGTSLTAEQVLKWGAYGGEPSNLHQGDRWNKRGYFEYLPVLKLVNSILGTQLYARNHEYELKNHTESMRKCIQEMTELAPVEWPWFWKIPRLTTMQSWVEKLILSDLGVLPNVIVVVRHPVSAVESQRRYFEQKNLGYAVDTFPYHLALSTWQYYMATLVGLAENHRTIFVSMEDFVSSPSIATERLGKWLNYRYDLDNFRSTSMDMIPQRELVNYSSTTPLMSYLTNVQKNLYQILNDLCNDKLLPSSIDISGYFPDVNDINKLENWYRDTLLAKSVKRTM